MSVIDYTSHGDDNWNDDWREELMKDTYEVWERLAECRNRIKDIPIMAKLVYKYNPSKTKEQCLDRIITWVTDWNNQFNLIPDDEGYKKLLERM